MLVYRDYLTITMISFKVELTLTLVFFTSTLIEVECIDSTKCKELLLTTGFDIVNGLYNYSFATYFGGRGKLEKYLNKHSSNSSDPSNEENQNLILKFYDEIVKAFPMDPNQFCESLGEDFHKKVVDNILNTTAGYNMTPIQFCEGLAEKVLLSPTDFCKHYGYYKDEHPSCCALVVGDWFDNIIDIIKNNVYNDDKFYNFMMSFTKRNRKRSTEDEIWINKTKLSKYQMLYYEDHRQLFPKQIINLCTKSIKSNYFFSDDAYYNVVKSYTYDYNLSVPFKNTRSDVSGYLWENLKDLTVYQQHYYFYHQSILLLSKDKLGVYDCSVETFCKKECKQDQDTTHDTFIFS